jgi:hypothetical protein
MAKTKTDKNRSPGKPPRRVIDFEPDKELPKFRNGTPKSMNKKQIRARARRAQRITERELDALYKPMEEWDEEELARGRPRSADGSFRGAAPRWITRKMHEDAMAQFKGIVEGRMREETVTALQVMHNILDNNDIDEKGRPVVSASTKLEAAKFLLEHVVGRPTQRQEVDVSVRLQALLATATAGPLADGAETFALPPGGAYEEIVDAEEVEDDE